MDDPAERAARAVARLLARLPALRRVVEVAEAATGRPERLSRHGARRPSNPLVVAVDQPVV